MKLKKKWKHHIWKCWTNGSFPQVVPTNLIVKLLRPELEKAKSFKDFNESVTEVPVQLESDEFAELVSSLTVDGLSVAEDVDLAVEMFCEVNCHPCETDLLFYPKYIFGTMNPTVEEICAASKTGLHNGKAHTPEDYYTFYGVELNLELLRKGRFE